MWINSQAWGGAERYNEFVEKISSMNLVLFFEVFGIAVPILFHGLYGIVVWWSGKSNVGRYGYLHNWMFAFQRVSGFLVLAFILWHAWETRIAVALDHSIKEDLFGHMVTLLSNPITLILYFLGTTLAAFHLANGLWTMGIAWGLTTTQRAQKLSFAAFMGVGVLITVLGIRSLLGFLLQTNVTQVAGF